MSWITLTEDDVLAGLSGAEAAAHRTVLLSPGQSDPLVAILASVTQEVRSRVKACDSNKLDEDGATIPDECRHHAAALARYRLLSRFPLEIAESRREEMRSAEKFLNNVAACKVSIVQPTTPTDDVSTASVPLPCWSGRTRQFTRETSDGI